MSTPAPEPLSAAVVGCGMGAHHARVLAALDEYRLAAVCDLDEALARKTAQPFSGTAVYTDFARMLAETKPDVVAVAVPNQLHERLTIQAAQAGTRGICCEKPMAGCLADGRAMLSACRTHGTALIVNHQRRLTAVFEKMRALIAEGAIGEVHLLRGSCAGDVLSDGTHLVDTIRALSGDEEAAWVFGQLHRDPPGDGPKGRGFTVSGGYRFGHPVETGAFGIIQFAGGARAEILCGTLQMPKRRYCDFEVHGSRGCLWRPGDGAEPPLLIRDAQGGGWRPLELPKSGPHRNDGMFASYRRLARLVREGGGAHPLRGESALKDLEIVMALYESARLRRRIQGPLQQPRFPLEIMLEEGQL